MSKLYSLEALGNDEPAAPTTGLYLHLPFCSVKCKFCDFAAFPGRKKDVGRYLQALDSELGGLASRFPNRRLSTIFMGGGTPSLLTADEFQKVSEDVRRHFTFAHAPEVSVECNPESVNYEKLEAYRRFGVNRLSMGLQTADPSLLIALGRLHDWEDFQTAYRSARLTGFDNLNVDLIYGLPRQTMASWRDTLRRVIDLDPEHISAYALSVEDKTYFWRQGLQPDSDLQADMYESAAAMLAEAGYGHYEISNFAKPGRECRHNLRYWENDECLAAGVSAAGYSNGTRWKNTSDLTEYITAMETGASPIRETIQLSEEERVGEDLMLALRLKKGVRLSARARELYGEVLDRFSFIGLLEDSDDHYRATLTGWQMSNRIFQELLSPPAAPDTVASAG